MPCPINGKLLSSIEAGIHPALKYDFGNSPRRSAPTSIPSPFQEEGWGEVVEIAVGLGIQGYPPAILIFSLENYFYSIN